MAFDRGRYPWRLRRELWPFLVAALTVTVPRPGWAAPYPGMGEAPVAGSEGATGHKEAIARARRAALEAALQTIEEPVDPQARARVLASPELWTSAFRILRADDDGATLRVEIEADIDLQRLTKELRPPAAAPVRSESMAHRIGKVDVRDCPEDKGLRDHVEGELARRGFVDASGKNPLAVLVRCRVVGPVPHSELHAVRLELGLTSGRIQVQKEGTGVAETGSAAALIALDRAVDAAASQLRGKAGDGVLLKIEPGAPAGHIRRFVRQVARSVVGVREVNLDGVEPDGAVRFLVQSDVELRELARRLQALPPGDVPVRLVAIAAPNVMVVHVD